MSNEMSMDEMIEVLARYRYNAKHDADRIKALEDELGRMRAEVERLRKAGDEVCESPYLLETDPAVIAWRAAKEGKQS